MPLKRSVFSAETQHIITSLAKGFPSEQHPDICSRSFLHLLDHHRLASHFMLQLQQDKLTPKFKEHLEQKQLILKEQAILQLTALVQILKEFETNQLPVLCLKGLPLAQRLYGDVSKRPGKDIDLLVSEEHLELASKILHELNYQRDERSLQSSKQIRDFKKVRPHYLFTHRDNSCEIELHWRILSSPVSNTWEQGILLSELKHNRLWNVELLQLPPLDEALYLCIHGTRHAWFRLFWLNDLLELLRKNEVSFAQELLDHAKQFSLQVHVELAYNLLQKIKAQGISLPELTSSKRLEQATQICIETWRNAEDQDGKDHVFRPKQYGHFYRLIYLTQGSLGLVNEMKYRRIKPENWPFFVFPDPLFGLNHAFSRSIWFFRKLRKR